MSTVTFEASFIRDIHDTLDSYLRFILDHTLTEHNRILALAVGKIRLGLGIDPNGQECFEDVDLEKDDREDLKKAFADFIASTQDIFCRRQRDVIAKLSRIVEYLNEKETLGQPRASHF